MNVIPPITVRAAELTSSTLAFPATGETAWSSSSVAYVVGDTATYTINGLIQKFKAKQDHTSSPSNAPVAYPNENAYWLDLGAANRYNMFHLERNTQSIGASPLIVEITPNARFGAVGIGHIEADTVRLQIYDGVTVIYDLTRDLISRKVASWYDYFYQPFRQIENTLFFDLPILSTAKIKLTFTKASGNVKVGFVVMGMPFELGKTMYRAASDALNFSEISRDDFGEAKLTPRRDIPTTDQTVRVTADNLDQARAAIHDLNAKVALWFGLSDPLQNYFDSLFIIGLYKKRSISMDEQDVAYLRLELEQI